MPQVYNFNVLRTVCTCTFYLVNKKRRQLLLGVEKNNKVNLCNISISLNINKQRRKINNDFIDANKWCSLLT